MESGLENQCWKDSWDSILFADGRLAAHAARDLRDPGVRLRRQGPLRPPGARGLARPAPRREARGKRRRSEAAVQRSLLDPGARLLRPGARRGEAAGRLAHLEHRAPALERDRDDEKAQAVAERLLSEELFSGWGIRTMATTEGGYNPIRYHDGTVWPHDNSLIALGLARYGFRRQVATIAQAIVEAATFFRDRLPEVFAGYPRSLSRYPVQYPTACSPQAWASGAPLALITAMLRLEPAPTGSPPTRSCPTASERLICSVCAASKVALKSRRRASRLLATSSRGSRRARTSQPDGARRAAQRRRGRRRLLDHDHPRREADRGGGQRTGGRHLQDDRRDLHADRERRPERQYCVPVGQGGDQRRLRVGQQLVRLLLAEVH